jgi:hypothetical protein
LKHFYTGKIRDIAADFVYSLKRPSGAFLGRDGGGYADDTPLGGGRMICECKS